MIKSMTGFGRGDAQSNGLNIIAEIKSVNHRYCEISAKLPKRFNFAEEILKNIIKEYTSRGKIELSISFTDDSFDASALHLNLEAAKAYADALDRLNNEVLGGKSTISLSMLSSNPEVLKTVVPEDDEEKLIALLGEAVRKACENYNAMRSIEGKKLSEDLLLRNNFVLETVKEIEKYAPEVKKNYFDKLHTRIASLLDGSVEIPEDKILQEAAIYADKIDITEEITRLKSHTSQFVSILNKDEPVGKQLDFLVQEMNRETNTICSKCNDIDITKYGLALKNEIEKIREQIQNIE